MFSPLDSHNQKKEKERQIIKIKTAKFIEEGGVVVQVENKLETNYTPLIIEEDEANDLRVWEKCNIATKTH